MGGSFSFITSEAKKINAVLKAMFKLVFQRSKDNQTMKFGQIIEYNMRNIFLKKVIIKMWRRNSPHTLF